MFCETISVAVCVLDNSRKILEVLGGVFLIRLFKRLYYFVDGSAKCPHEYSATVIVEEDGLVSVPNSFFDG